MWSCISVQERKAVRRIKTCRQDLATDQHPERLDTTDWLLDFFSVWINLQIMLQLTELLKHFSSGLMRYKAAGKNNSKTF